MTYTMQTEHDLVTDEFDRAHEEFLAEIVHLDSTTVQRLFKTVAEDGEVSTPTLNGEQQYSASAS